MEKQRTTITPLWIIAAFVTLTETILGYAVTQTSNGVQITLTIFVMFFAVIVAFGFFIILWHRPYVFYSPLEYGNVDPGSFISAVSKSNYPSIASQIELVEKVERNPNDTSAKFALINSLIDSVTRQHIILMAENKLAIPYSDSFGHRYRILVDDKSYTDGLFRPGDFLEHLKGTDFAELVNDNGAKVKLTLVGFEFGRWLVENNHRSIVMDTPLGGWGNSEDLPEPFNKPTLRARAKSGDAAS